MDPREGGFSANTTEPYPLSNHGEPRFYSPDPIYGNTFS